MNITVDPLTGLPKLVEKEDNYITHGGGLHNSLVGKTTDDLTEGTTNLYSQWIAFGSNHLTPDAGTNDAVITGDTDGWSEVSALTGGTENMFISPTASALNFFSVVSVGDTGGFTPWGSLLLSARADGSPGSEAQSDAGDWLGGHVFAGYADDSEYSLNATSDHLGGGFWADVAATPSGGNVPLELWMGGANTHLISVLMDGTQDKVQVNSWQGDVDFEVYDDTGLALNVAGTNGDVNVYNDLTVDGNLGAGADSPSAWVHVGAGTTTNPAIKLDSGTFLSSTERGSLEYDGRSLTFTATADRHAISQSDGVVVADVTVANTTDETTVYTENVGANELYKGSKWHTRFSGYYSTANANDTYTMRMKIGGTTIDSFTSTAENVTNGFFRVEWFFTVRSTGASGTVQSSVQGIFNTTTNNNASASTDTIDTTSAENLTITIQWDSADPDDTLTLTQGHTDVYGVQQA